MRDYISDKETAEQKERSAVSDFTYFCNYDDAFLFSSALTDIRFPIMPFNDYICRLRIIFRPMFSKTAG